MPRRSAARHLACRHPGQTLTLVQQAIFYALSYLPGLGLAMLSDPASRKAKTEYLKIDFYAPKELADGE